MEEAGLHTVRPAGDSLEEEDSPEVLRMVAGRSLRVVVVPEVGILVDLPAVLAEDNLVVADRRMEAARIVLLVAVAAVVVWSCREGLVVLAVMALLHMGHLDGSDAQAQLVGRTRTGFDFAVGCIVLESIGLEVLRRSSLLKHRMRSSRNHYSIDHVAEIVVSIMVRGGVFLGAEPTLLGFLCPLR